MQTLNKGEWAEFYAFIRLLARGRLYYGDKDLNIIEDEYFDIDKILKTKTGKADHIFYIYDENIKSDGVEITKLKLDQKADIVFKHIASGKSTFSIPEAEELKENLNLDRFSEPSSSKADIRLSLIDKLTNKSEVYGFSIKTKLKAKSTLINSSGKSTGFRYEILKFNRSFLEQVNSINGGAKINKRVLKILELGGKIVFDTSTSQIYKNNLKMVDTSLDDIIGELLISAYINNEKLLKNAIKTDRFISFYKSLELDEDAVIYKIKNFLNISAIGMTPSKSWDGASEVDGGLIIVKSTGDLVGYFVFSLNKFKEYLWLNTYFETPSTTRHNFGYVYDENGKFYFDLNIQVRFY